MLVFTSSGEETLPLLLMSRGTLSRMIIRYFEDAPFATKSCTSSKNQTRSTCSVKSM